MRLTFSQAAVNTHWLAAPRKIELNRHKPQVRSAACIAFGFNSQTATGFVNAVQNYPSATMWDTASYLGALVAARQLGVIRREEFDTRLRTLLKTMNAIVLFRSELPNKVYQAQTAEKVDYANKPGEIGFSALDLGRLLIWLYIIKERFPEHANAIDDVLRWDFSHVVDRCGTLYGALLAPDSKTQYVQEGRLGYEEYSAKGFQAKLLNLHPSGNKQNGSVVLYF